MEETFDVKFESNEDMLKIDKMGNLFMKVCYNNLFGHESMHGQFLLDVHGTCWTSLVSLKLSNEEFLLNSMKCLVKH